MTTTQAEPLGVRQVQDLCQMARVRRIGDDEVQVVLEGWDESDWDSGDLCFVVGRRVDPELFRRLCRDDQRDAALEDFFDRLFRLALIH
jgi:hypothetical protein